MPTHDTYYHGLRLYVDNSILPKYARLPEFGSLWLLWHEINPQIKAYLEAWRFVSRGKARLIRAGIVQFFNREKGLHRRSHYVNQFLSEIHDTVELVIKEFMMENLKDVTIARTIANINAEALQSHDPYKWLNAIQYIQTQ